MLHPAVEAKDVKAVEAALAAKADVNEFDARGFTALEKAATYGPLPLVKALLEAGADPHRGRSSALGAAAKRRSEPMVELLLAHGANPNHTNDPNLVPLHWALRCSARCALLLIEKGAIVDDAAAGFIGSTEGTALEKQRLVGLAISNTSRPQALLGALIEAGPNKELERWIRQLLSKGASLAPGDAVSPLHLAALGTHAAAVKALMNAGASLETPLAIEWHQDEGSIPVGQTVRQLFTAFLEEELGSKPSSAHKQRLIATAQALGLGAEASKPATTPAPHPSGTWVEVERRSRSAEDDDGRTERVTGGVLEWRADGRYTVSGTVGCGMPVGGTLSFAGTKVTLKVKGDDPRTGRFANGRLELSSLPDDEHGLVVTSVFEQKPAESAKKAPVKKASVKKPKKK